MVNHLAMMGNDGYPLVNVNFHHEPERSTIFFSWDNENVMNFDWAMAST